MLDINQEEKNTPVDRVKTPTCLGKGGDGYRSPCRESHALNGGLDGGDGGYGGDSTPEADEGSNISADHRYKRKPVVEDGE